MKNITNKLLIVIALIGTSEIIKADGFFKSVGNVATLGELNRSERREEEKKSKNKKETKKSTSKKRSKTRKQIDE